MEAEIARLREECENDIKKFQEKLEEECQVVTDATKKSIELETAYLRNRFDIECSKLRQEIEKKVDEINKNRYKDMAVITEVTKLPDYHELLAKNRKQIEADIARDIEEFQRETKERQMRFDNQIKILVEVRERKDIDFLKKAVLPIVDAETIKHLPDETILETRHQIKITRNAIRSGPSWALYKAIYKGKNALCRVRVLNNVPVEIRKEFPNTAKCARFLGKKLNDYFIGLYDIFSTNEKIYYFMDEFNPMNLSEYIKGRKVEAGNAMKWTYQMADAFQYMHTYAIAHFNIRPENIMFNESNNIKVVGLSRTFFYFNLDMEALRKAPKMTNLGVLTDHLPSECFTGEFSPRPADSYSYGLLVYNMFMSMIKDEAGKTHKVSSKLKTKVVQLTFEKIPNEDLQGLLEKLLCDAAMVRPRFDEVTEYPCFAEFKK